MYDDDNMQKLADAEPEAVLITKKFTASSKLEFEEVSASTCFTPRHRKSEDLEGEEEEEVQPLVEVVSSNVSGISDFWLKEIPQVVEKKNTFDV